MHVTQDSIWRGILKIGFHSECSSSCVWCVSLSPSRKSATRSADDRYSCSASGLRRMTPRVNRTGEADMLGAWVPVSSTRWKLPLSGTPTWVTPSRDTEYPRDPRRTGDIAYACLVYTVQHLFSAVRSWLLITAPVFFCFCLYIFVWFFWYKRMVIIEGAENSRGCARGSDETRIEIELITS